MLKVHPHLWFADEAEDAARFYTAIFRNSRINAISHYPDAMKDRAGTVMTVDFELDGLPVTALNAGPGDPFNTAISLYVETGDQDETDYYWNALIADGGKEQPCGWLTDRFGLYWQVCPERMMALLNDPDRAKASRAMSAMLQMKKIVIADIEAAASRSKRRSW